MELSEFLAKLLYLNIAIKNIPIDFLRNPYMLIRSIALMNYLGVLGTFDVIRWKMCLVALDLF